MKNAFDWLITRLNTAEQLRKASLKDTSRESTTSKSKKTEKDRTEYARTRGQLQKVEHMHNSKIRRRRKKRQK